MASSMVTLLLVFSLFCKAITEAAVATTGPFTITWDPNTSPSIKVVHENDIVWFTSLHDSVATAIKGSDVVHQNGGDYIIHSTTEDECDDVSFERMNTIQTNTTAQVIISGKVSCNKDVITMTFQAVLTVEKFYHLFFNLTIHTRYYNKLKLVYGCKEMEQFYGLGVQYTYFNMRGHRVPLFISEQGVGRGLEPVTASLDLLSPGAGGSHFTTYSRVPFYVTNYNRSLLIESLDYAIFHVPLIGTSVTIETNGTSLIGRIITGGSPLDILQSYTSYTGRMKPLPEWFHNGAILGLQGGTDIVMDILMSVKKVMGSWDDLVGVWLQDWTGQRNITGKKDLPRTGLWWNWEVDDNHYPRWEEFIQLLSQENIRVTTYINPLVINVSNRGSPYQHNYYDEGMTNGYFIKESNGEVWSGYSDSCLVDLTNPKAYDWFKNMIIENMLATNVSGWMCDFGESVPLDAVLYDGRNANQFHATYSVVWAQLNTEAIIEAAVRKVITREQASEIVYFMRSGSVFSPGVTSLFWLGDQLVSWDQYDGLGSCIIGLLSSGMVGFTLTHSDIGGYTALKVSLPFLNYIRDKELLMRWSEFAAFTVVYRSHQGTLPDDNWQFYTTTDSMEHFFRMSRVFVAWKFYRTTLIDEAVSKGWPVARHMVLVYPGNKAVQFEDLRYQYMLGTELLVAPVHEKGDVSVRVFLPEYITWVHVWTNSTYQGHNAWVVISAPFGCPVVLYPHGSAIGKQFVDNLSNKGLLKSCHNKGV